MRGELLHPNRFEMQWHVSSAPGESTGSDSMSMHSAMAQ